MANEVVIKQIGDKFSVWIQNEKEKRISKKYIVSERACINITEEFLEILTNGPYIAQKFISYQEKLIINIQTLNILYREKFNLDDDNKYRKLATDYLYLDPKSHVLKSSCNNSIDFGIKEFTKFSNDIIIVKTNSNKYDIISLRRVLLEDVDFYKVLNPSKFLFLQSGHAKIYDSNQNKIIIDIEISKGTLVDYDIIISNNREFFLFTKYEIVNDDTIKFVSEIRNLNNLSKVILEPNNNEDIIQSEDLQNYDCIVTYIRDIGHKIFSLEKNRYLSNECTHSFSVLNGDRNSKYLLLKFANRIDVYSLPDFDLLISGEYSDITISNDKKHFILVTKEYMPIPTITVEKYDK